MPTQGFGSVDVTQSWTGSYAYTEDIGLPTGRFIANGSAPALITALYGYCAGRGSTRSMVMTLGAAQTGVFAMGAMPYAVDTGWIGTNGWLVQGGSARYSYSSDGSFFFARQNGGGGATWDSAGGYWDGMLAGNYSYAIGPNAPILNAATPQSSSGVVQLNFSGSSDNGGAGISGYLVQWATNAAFTVNLGQTITQTGTPNITGLQIGTTYYFRVSSRNAVTDAANSTGAWSNVRSALAPGVPGAPTALTATPSTTAFGSIRLNWTAPANTAGGITGYSIYNGTTLVATTTGTSTTSTINNLVSNTSYTYTVRARNSYADQVKTTGPASNSASAVAPGPPTAPLNISAVASISTAGRVTVTWDAPSVVGTGGVTRYSLYFSTGELITSSIPSGTRTYNVDGLIPGTLYGFYVRAWNAIADTVGTPGPSSAIVNTTAMGQPNAPTNLALVPSTVVTNRLTLSWSLTGSYTGFNIYEVTTGPEVFVGYTRGLQYIFDNLTPTPHKYVVRARNAVTDATNPVSQGPSSVPVEATPGTTTSQTTSPKPIANNTNNVFNGTYNIVGSTATTFTYARLNANIPTTGVSGVSVLNNTNTTLNGTYTILTTPAAGSFTYSRTVPDISAGTAVLRGNTVNNTNTDLSGTYSVSAVDNNNRTVSYAKTYANMASRVTLGSVVNTTNTIYNGTGLVITAVGKNTISYTKTSANIAESTATGTVTDVTNVTRFNGTYVVLSTPSYLSFTYAKVAPNVAITAMGTGDAQSTEVVNGRLYRNQVFRAISSSKLIVKYRSGWIG